MVWTNGGTELLYLFPRHAIPVDPVEAFMGRRSPSGTPRSARKAPSPPTPT
jgi:hypothetical protein